MSLLPFTFDAASHIYKAEGHYVLATSDVIDLMAISDLMQIPAATLRKASERGTALHQAIESYEMACDWQGVLPEEHMPYMDGWFAFRDAHEIKVLPPMEKRYVYLHEETAIGATIDCRFLYEGDLWIGDVKSVYPVTGKALKQKHLSWRLQTESYKTATEMDEEFLSPLRFKKIKRCIIHIHPKLKGGFAFHRYESDDSFLWNSAVQIAAAKIAAGLVPSKKRTNLQDQPQAWDAGTEITDADMPEWMKQQEEVW